MVKSRSGLVPPHRRGVLVLRTSRFVDVAVHAARVRWPGVDLRVEGRNGPITPAGIVTSRWGWRLLAWRPCAVVLQWWNPDGYGHEAATWAALLIAPRRVYAVLADGTWIRVTAARRAMHACRPAWRGLRGALLVTMIAMASAAAWPAAVWFRRRKRRRFA
jgi:hypothetical protein